MALARRFAPEPRVPGELPVSKDGILIAVGSANRQSHRQADRLGAAAGVCVMRAPADPCEDPRRVLAQLVASAVRRLRAGGIGALIATGGDTMEAILDTEAIAEFVIAGEVQAGFPLGVAQRPNGSSLLLAMKAGGFGDDETLVRALQRLRGPSKPNETAAP